MCEEHEEILRTAWVEEQALQKEKEKEVSECCRGAAERSNRHKIWSFFHLWDVRVCICADFIMF